MPASLMLLALLATEAEAQTLTSDLLRPERDGFSGQNRPLRRITTTTRDQNNVEAETARRDTPAPSRIGQIPTFEAPAAAGASSMGYDSLNRKKKRPARPKPGVSPTVLPKEPVTGPPVQITPTIVPVAPPPPPLPSATANRPRLAPSMMGTVVGQPQRRRLKVDDDPFGPVGFYRGSMLVKPAVEFYAGYDTNPGRVLNGKGSWLYMVAPELLVASDWERHSLIADLRGSFTGYSLKNHSTGGIAQPIPVDIDRPDFTGKVNGRLDVSRDTRIETESRLRIGTDNPGSPNIEANLQRYPLYASFGNTLGGAHTYNRFEIAARGAIDRTVYQESTLSDGSRSSNSDRNYNQFGGRLRGSYEIMPHVKPFGEVELDTRERDEEFDRNGFARSSRGRTGRVGSTFELGALITGEASIGYTTRVYEDPRLRDAKGLVGQASLVWKPTGLTTVTLGANSLIDESTLPGVSGVITRSYNAQIEHAFRRYLIATLKGAYTTADYDGGDRFDKIYSIGGDLVYKFTRDVHLKAQLRHDWLRSNIPSADYDATLVMLGVRLQR